MSEKDAHTLGPWPLVEVRRGAVCESRHRGHLAAVARDRRVVARLGSPEAVTYLRSSAKPHQAVPLVASGAADRFRLTDQELAVACGSHNGEPRHVEVVAGILRKIGVDRDALKCGTHEPFGREAARRLRERGEEPTVLHNNCSGKHAGMLALARHLGAPVETYERPEHPAEALRQLDAGREPELRALASFARSPVKDRRGETAGEVRPSFKLSLGSGVEGVESAQ